ncbi:hypothetical protein CO057_02655 [Candidatus Uhrbacteria bacterium CG_4_9_14_0_2_um_filter_41_50]|uniref:Transcriptional repressor PaaX-like central Cas2-like domain-containing protein n=1 Tax=Candidatus Uhrbacteria bacterium CG_4_9_14_0_2_um_filter_41_50 TaxID=1975031 RepID=A0A2M8ENZ5_9BACT|nr:MAG: hypothetical protein COZ45_00290 [Candidatus Uhrbacteria bacterium CG_4_10_14_3_um_filter_41_21]PIZ55345.1 MAG: hypothetical protein COY24_00760 [Candidatus Uhrbacteria bacterium CG_4_10_14_0_2_um_filter_41_21]PJB84568.1 MAG: hypothetical protein CO086_02935 [Candidatus Uhrbacteria bacterium CG_4_9_14_0_8_um_filter_41_16]PJC24472.1 MAG: hypothetical protein CO057_02655 [Candidatus Uhrbacteria bacterium CG_4_9_14_0_2_um_filter_41_50]PJE75422.1 MAG: hypothetical protein COV03_00230 [Candi
MKQFRKKHLKPNSVAAQLLEEIVETADDFFTLGYNPTAVLRFGLDGYKEIRNRQEERQRRAALKRLEEKKLIEDAKIADEYRGNVTEAGMQEFFRIKLSQCELLDDGFVSVVVFDVPESQRGFRKNIRELLKEIGFMQIQKSVWISPFDVCDTLMKMFGKTKRKWIRCFIAREVR